MMAKYWLYAYNVQLLLQHGGHDRQVLNGFSSGFVRSLGHLLEGTAIMPKGMLTDSIFTNGLR